VNCKTRNFTQFVLVGPEMSKCSRHSAYSNVLIDGSILSLSMTKLSNERIHLPIVFVRPFLSLSISRSAFVSKECGAGNDTKVIAVSSTRLRGDQLQTARLMTRPRISRLSGLSVLPPICSLSLSLSLSLFILHTHRVC
jgi:hypothetical protein